MTAAGVALPVGRMPAGVAHAVVWASWPVGFLLIMAYTLGGLLSPPVFLGAAVVFAVLLGLALSASAAPGTTYRLDARLLVVAGPLIFVLAGLTGPPTAAAPAAMLLNAAVLALAAAVTLVAAIGLVLGLGRLGRSAALGLVTLTIGTTGWLVNLVARWAVVLSGAADRQAQVEGRAWMANVYLRGLAGEPDFLSFTLVWMDLLQVAFVVLGYLGFGLLARALTQAQVVRPRTGSVLVIVSLGLAGVALGCAALAAWVGPLGTVAAWTAFVLTIPFMSTLVPYLLGATMVTRPQGSAGADQRRGDQLGSSSRKPTFNVT